MVISWTNINNLPSKEFLCGFCSANLVSEKGYKGIYNPNGEPVHLYYCHNCGKLNYFDQNDAQLPGASIGDEVLDVTDETVSGLYTEEKMLFY